MRRTLLISIVDDDESMREATKGLVRSLGYHAATFSSAEEFLNSDLVQRTSCLITDMQMPAMGGGEFISVLKSKPETANIPIVILTGRSSGYDQGENRAEFTIFKDIDIQEQLEKALAAQAMGRAAKAQSSGN